MQSHIIHVVSNLPYTATSHYVSELTTSPVPAAPLLSLVVAVVVSVVFGKTYIIEVGICIHVHKINNNIIANTFTVVVTLLAGIVLSVSLCVLCFHKKNLTSEKDDQVNYTIGN